MPDPFARLIPDARVFLSALAADNRRDWFTENKARYDSELKAPALLLLDQVAHDLGRTSGREVGTKLFRPHRDVRFSKDKTPYHTHLHMLWTFRGTGPGTGDQAPALFLGISPDYVQVGGGVMGFDKPVLERWRQAMDTGAGDAFQTVLEDLAALGLVAQEPELKRVPTPFGKDHRHGALLRRKGLTVWRELPSSQFGSPQKALTDTFEALQPMLEWLQEVL